MYLIDQVSGFITKPYPLWNNTLTEQLVKNRLQKIYGNSVEGWGNYSLSECILKNGIAEETTTSMQGIAQSIKIIHPSISLYPFYEQHGLQPLIPHNLLKDAIIKVQKAIAILDIIPEISSFITHIIRSIQILNVGSPDVDISYSHPDIPFSIFISVCEESSTISYIRTAESILHEAMHLLLTLIENSMPMVNSNKLQVYYSPWRNEERPVRGVLHGLFVFKAISNFYTSIEKKLIEKSTLDYIKERIVQISHEISLLREFPNALGLTLEGRALVSKLLL